MGKNTIDEKIDERLWEKNTVMHRILNSPDLQELDYDGNVIKSEEWDVDYKWFVDHLRDLHKQNKKKNDEEEEKEIEKEEEEKDDEA